MCVFFALLALFASVCVVLALLSTLQMPATGIAAPEINPAATLVAAPHTAVHLKKMQLVTTDGPLDSLVDSVVAGRTVCITCQPAATSVAVPAGYVPSPLNPAAPAPEGCLFAPPGLSLALNAKWCACMTNNQHCLAPRFCLLLVRQECAQSACYRV